MDKYPTTQRPPSEHAGRTVSIRADAFILGGLPFQVDDWWINVAGASWLAGTCPSIPAITEYAVRAGFSGLGASDDVLYGQIGVRGHLVHISEIEVSTP